MQLSNILSIITLAVAASATTVSYDTGYDDASRSLDVVSCSDGENGLEPRYGWHVQGDVAGFPYIGGVEDIEGWNSESCGTCWEVTYKGKTIHILGIDHSATGLNIALAAMNDLTNNQAEALGRVDATVTKVDISNCGL